MASCKDMPKENTLILKKSDNTRQIAVKCGDVIQIELEGIGGTGYRWHIDNLDPEYLVLLSGETKPLTEGRTGAPVLGIWRFKVLKEGKTEIKMDYYREWEGADKAAERFTVRLNIQK